jgi:hypothetical protein
MRRLSELEIQKIDQRLKSLKIRYIEIYEEIRDHYITTLEQVSLEKFDAKKEVLDDEFAWSVVRKMEKELSKHVSKQVLVAQLDFLKFWNHGIKGLLIALVGLTALVISIFSIPPSELILVFLAIIICTAVGVFIIKRDALSFSLSHKTVFISSAIALKRIGILNSVFVWIYAMPNIFTRGAILTNTLFVAGMGIVTVISMMYSISLLAIASSLHKPKLL